MYSIPGEHLWSSWVEYQRELAPVVPLYNYVGRGWYFVIKKCALKMHSLRIA